MTEKTFEASAAGILEAQEWLLKELDAFNGTTKEAQQ